MADLDGRTVLVTGASRGIGRAIAIELGRQGAHVAVHYRSNAEAARAVVAELRALGAAATDLPADIRRPEEVRDLVDRAAAWRGRLDGVVTSAGIFRGEGTAEVDPKGWAEVLATDLEGTFRTVQAAIPHLRSSPHAAIVTISSILGSHAEGGGVPYQAAKAGIEQMTRALALELAPRIRVNCVAPGFIRTDMNRAAHTDPAFHDEIARSTPLGRWGEPEDVASAVAFLLGPEATWITGGVLPVDGGLPLA